MTTEHLRARVATLLAVTVALDLVASVLAYLFERHAPATGITTLGDALFWTSTQLLTVSSQLPNPITAPRARARRAPAGLRDLRGRDPRRLVRRLLPSPRDGGRVVLG